MMNHRWSNQVTHLQCGQDLENIPNPKRGLRVTMGLRRPWLLGWSLVTSNNPGRTCLDQHIKTSQNEDTSGCVCRESQWPRLQASLGALPLLQKPTSTQTPLQENGQGEELAKMKFYYSKEWMRRRNSDMTALKRPLTGLMEGLQWKFCSAWKTKVISLTHLSLYNDVCTDKPITPYLKKKNLSEMQQSGPLGHTYQLL